MLSFVNTDLDGDVALSMKTPKFVATLSKMELSKSTEVMNPITVLQNLLENYEAFLAYCPSDVSEYDDSYTQSVYSSYGTYDYGPTELCKDPESVKFNEDIKLGHAKLINNSTSKTFFVIGFSLFDSFNATEIEDSYEKITTLFKLKIAHFSYAKYKLYCKVYFLSILL